MYYSETNTDQEKEKNVQLQTTNNFEEDLPRIMLLIAKSYVVREVEFETALSLQDEAQMLEKVKQVWGKYPHYKVGKLVSNLMSIIKFSLIKFRWAHFN